MADARGRTLTVRIAATASDGRDAEFSASGTAITFRGFLLAYEESRDDDVAREGESPLPDLKQGDALTALSLDPDGHETTPPPRYTEATLVKTLEELGIGRPSTYASIIGTILERGYVFKKGTALVPSFLAFAVVALLEQHFTKLVDYDFTARLEDDLDQIAAGDTPRNEWLHRFYFGDGDGAGLKALVSDLGEIDARAINSIPIGNGIVLRVGRYGPYLERGSDRATLNDDIAPDELTVERAEELLAQQTDSRALGIDPESGNEIVVRGGRYGPYVSEVLPDEEKRKPRTGSLFKSMSPETITLEDALRLLSLPRMLGEHEGEEVTALNGRYGPYVKRGKETRSLESEEQLFEVTLEEALELLSKPKERRGRGTAAAPLAELGPDPVTGKPVVVRSGRFGPYVTDGEVNASLKKGDNPESLTIERAAELLAERRARGPATPRKKGKTAAA
jgi:DNA topoisomerase-1